ncbi:PREDICTED: uncharacterized protein LOC109326242 isoform X3 [Lupinus angustifolius]|uniref:uncharacterized protein LOC109326242 isoform X3 n=1 Tax=Lupinus angustifolius TaxID=3871 RepID=UPI00092F4647|nr:PREDICTED: uncharacterized protein LOC109326242 isoform X3 [Lupinus angustifolius]
MVSREQKRIALHEKLQLLRSITNSHASSKSSIIIDASKYIEKLKKKVEGLNIQDMATAQTSTDPNHLPMVTVETLGKGFVVNVISSKRCHGLLVYILEAFEEIHLNVKDARVSCAETFRFQALGEVNEEQDEHIDVEAVEEAMGQAIKNWNQSSDQQ